MALFPVIGKLQRQRVVLASASPRRQEILSTAGLRFEVVPSRFKETLDKASFASPSAYAMETAKQKALEVARRLHQKDLRAPDVVIGADTVVAVDGLILEKPADKQDAYRMLSRLSGREHGVFTGVCIVRCRVTDGDGRLEMDVTEFHEETRVTFSELSEEMLWDYIHSGEPMDKAGGYGIQALGGLLVERVAGDFLNVVGFPLNHFCKQLAQLYGPVGATRDPIPPVDSPEPVGAPDGSGRSGDSCPAQARGDPLGQRSGDAACPGVPDPGPPFPEALLALIHGFKASQALFAACALRVFDVLRDAGGPRDAGHVAAAVGTSPGGMRRLLRACAALGLLRKTQTGYANSALAARHLVSDGAASLHAHILHTRRHAWPHFAQLEAAILHGADHHYHDGDPAQTTGDPAQDTAERLMQLRSEHGLAHLTAPRVAGAFALGGVSTACHLGGRTGALAAELARRYPRLSITVFDTPDVIELSPRFHHGGPEAAQVTFLPGDVFTDPLPQAELYILAPIPPAWPDDTLQGVLRRVAGACPPGAGVLLAGAFPGEDDDDEDEEDATAPGGVTRARLDLLADTAAPARGVDTCRRWLQELGFRDVRVAPSRDTVTVLLATR
ncbi:putative bifunctional dTTP/UTP pyrophosphatase/methyltransferase protein [Ctenodactylus gundi]